MLHIYIYIYIYDISNLRVNGHITNANDTLRRGTPLYFYTVPTSRHEQRSVLVFLLVYVASTIIVIIYLRHHSTPYSLDGSVFEPLWGKQTLSSPPPSRPAIGTPIPLYNGFPSSFAGGKKAGAWRWPASPHHRRVSFPRPHLSFHCIYREKLRHRWWRLFRRERIVSLHILYIGDKKPQLVGVLCLVITGRPKEY